MRAGREPPTVRKATGDVHFPSLGELPNRHWVVRLNTSASAGPNSSIRAARPLALLTEGMTHHV